MAGKRGPIPLAQIDRLMRSVGVKRISDGARKYMRDLAVYIVQRVTEKAAELAKHAGRKTLKKEDIKLAARELGLPVI